LQPAGEGSHRIQVTNNGQTYKTDFHGNSLALKIRKTALMKLSVAFI
jgi:hypothetical protein